MPRTKSLKTLFTETVVFVIVFALMGHLTVSFWERYVIQSELTKIKSSLYTLKDTINNIGVAYDHLYKEIKGLVVNPDECRLENDYVQTEKNTHNIKVIAKPPTKNMKTQKILCTNEKNTQILQENKKTQEIATPREVSKRIGPENVDRNTLDSNNLNKKLMTNPEIVKNTTTITRNPFQSTEAATGPSLQKSPEKNDRNKDIHHFTKCHDDSSKAGSNFWKF